MALGSPHANRVNASETDRVGHRNNTGALFSGSSLSLPVPMHHTTYSSKRIQIYSSRYLDIWTSITFPLDRHPNCIHPNIIDTSGSYPRTLYHPSYISFSFSRQLQYLAAQAKPTIHSAIRHIRRVALDKSDVIFPHFPNPTYLQHSQRRPVNLPLNSLSISASIPPLHTYPLFMSKMARIMH